jgi:hypothetical protein
MREGMAPKTTVPKPLYSPEMPSVFSITLAVSLAPYTPQRNVYASLVCWHQVQDGHTECAHAESETSLQVKGRLHIPVWICYLPKDLWVLLGLPSALS